MTPVRIRLTRDLTKYHPALKIGAEGTTSYDRAPWGCWCVFPGAGRWDIISNSFEVIKES